VVSCPLCGLLLLQERISFNPHPKTLTMAGDYEYFAAQGHHPLAFALAELIDNALRATKGNSELPRSITVSLVTDEKGGKGMVCVRDNGSGMTVQELNNWAVMNLSMEDRGLLNTEEEKSE
jgi:signal transduction histidine kinase